MTERHLFCVVVCLLVFQARCLAADYYVDASGGRDANSGGSPSAAWRTIARVNAHTGFAPGDRILLKRGEVWREQLLVPCSGAPGKPIVFGAYGSGRNPLLKGSDLVAGWTEAGRPNTWKAPLSAPPLQVFFNGVRGIKRDDLESVDGSLEGYRRPHVRAAIPEEMGPDGGRGAVQWFWSNGILYVYATADPDGLYTDPGTEASVRPAARTSGLVTIRGHDHVTIENIDATHSNSFGLYLKSPGSHLTARGCEVSYSIDGGIVAPSGRPPLTQVTFESCISHHNNTGYKEGAPGVTTYHEGLTVENTDGFLVRGCEVYSNYMEGVNFKRGARNGVIENCRLHSNALINHYLEGAVNIVIRYNRIWGCTYNAGIEMGLETDTYSNDNIRIHHNLFWGNNGGVSFWSARVAAQTRNIRIDNNTFYGESQAIRWKRGATDNYSGTNAIRNNLFWQNGRGTAIKDDTVGSQATSRTTIAYNAFQQGAPSDTTGSNARILSESPFVDAAGLDFRLRPGSPCIDAGTDVGLARDFDGKPVPRGRAPDIGAYEHAAPAAR